MQLQALNGHLIIHQSGSLSIPSGVFKLLDMSAIYDFFLQVAGRMRPAGCSLDTLVLHAWRQSGSLVLYQDKFVAW